MTILERARQWGLIANGDEPEHKPSRWTWPILIAAFLADAIAVLAWVLWEP